MAYVDHLYDVNFLEYASYVIKERAIPHLDDGLKPVQRRILHTLHEMDDGKYHKVANIVGQCMKYHPHGDASIYEALVVLANKDLLIERQGNFGNIYTGDVAAAARYIECRLLPLAREALFAPEITRYEPSYDGRNQEPVTLPAKIPVLLIHGAEGIAVGMATKVLPHNFAELLDAQIACLQGKKFQVYPDLPTGGFIDVSEYADGNGKVLVRARLDTSDPKRIVVREIPFGTTTESLIASIEDAARRGDIKIAGISDFTAESVEIEIRLPRGVYTEEVVDGLYAFTDCQVSIAASLTLIRDNRPAIMSATDVIKANTERLVKILTDELKLEERKLKDRLHAKTLEQIFIEHRVYKAIEDKTTPEAVVAAVKNGLARYGDEIKREVTDEDIDTLLKIPIRRISLYDINRAQEEMREIQKRLREVRKNLGQIVEYAISFLRGIREKYAKQRPRRSEIVTLKKVDVREAARRNLKLRYDRKGGYLGTDVSGDVLFDVSPYDRILVMRRTGTYQIVDAPDKLFVDTGMLYCDFVDPDRIYTAAYKDKKNGVPCIKRFQIEKYVPNRTYEFVPEGSTHVRLETGVAVRVHVDYKPAPRVRILEEDFRAEDYPIRGFKAGGLKLARRECKGITLEPEKKAKSPSPDAAPETAAEPQMSPKNGKEKDPSGA